MLALLILGVCVSLIKPAPFYGNNVASTPSTMPTWLPNYDENSRYEIVLQSQEDSKGIKIILKRFKQPVEKRKLQVNVDISALRNKVHARSNQKAFLSCAVETNEKAQDVQIKWFAELVEHRTSEWRIMPQSTYRSSETGSHAFKTTLGVKKRKGLYRYKCQACLIKPMMGNECDEGVVILKVNNK